jgi:hypothetical protein
MRNLSLDLEHLDNLPKPDWMDVADFERAKAHMRAAVASILSAHNDLDAAWMVYRKLRSLVDAEKEPRELFGVPAQSKPKNRKRTKSKG